MNEFFDENAAKVAVCCRTCRTIFVGRAWSRYAGPGCTGGWTGSVPKTGCSSCKRESRETAKRLATPEVVAAVKAHAVANYDQDGWDFIVETYTDAELAEALKGCKTAKAGIRKAAGIAHLLNDRRQDVCNA